MPGLCKAMLWLLLRLPWRCNRMPTVRDLVPAHLQAHLSPHWRGWQHKSDISSHYCKSSQENIFLMVIFGTSIHVHGNKSASRFAHIWPEGGWSVYGLGERSSKIQPRRKNIAHRAQVSHVPTYLWSTLPTKGLLYWCYRDETVEGPWQASLSEGEVPITQPKMQRIGCWDFSKKPGSHIFHWTSGRAAAGLSKAPSTMLLLPNNGHEVGLHKARTKSHPAKFHTSFVPHVHKNMTECGQVEKQKQPKIDVF